MGKLTFTKKYSLEIVRRLKRRFVRGDVLFKNFKKEGGGIGVETELIAEDIRPILTPKKIEHISDVMQFLRDRGLDIKTNDDLANILLAASIEKNRPIVGACPVGTVRGDGNQIIIKLLSEILIELKKSNAGNDENNPISKKKGLKSIHLVTESVAVRDVIFMVLDERYEMPIRFDVKNHDGKDASIKKLHDIAYWVDAPGKKVDYNKRTSDNINNGLFKRRPIKDYMETGKLNSPTLVQKSENGNSLVLRNEIPVKTILIKAVPSQHRSLYIDKTR
jgi:hypothetical protein